MRIWKALIALLLIAGVAAAQDEGDKRRPPRAKPDCLDGSFYDDGKLERGVTSSLANDNFVMLIEAKSYPAKLTKVCLSWWRASFWDEVDFELRVWAADGPDGGPGTLVAAIPGMSATRVSLNRPKWYDYDVSGADVFIDGPVYIGPYWDPIQFFVGYLSYDAGPRTPIRPAYHNVGIDDSHPPQSSLTTGDLTSYKALGIRAVLTPQ